jgi:hypothetical protein
MHFAHNWSLSTGQAIEAPHRSKLRSGILLPREQFPDAGFAAKAERLDDMDEARKTLRLVDDNVTVKLHGDLFGSSRLNPEHAELQGASSDKSRHRRYKTHVGHHKPPRSDRVTKSGLQLAACADSNSGPGRHGRDNSAISFLPVVSDSAASPIR